jgi:transposase
MRVEVLGDVERRRGWSSDEKMRLVEETLVPGAKVSEVARRNGVSASLLFTWRRQARAIEAPAAVVPRFAAMRIAGLDPVAVIAKPPSDEPPRSRAATAGRSGLIEIYLGGGKRVRVDASFDAAALARVLDVLERR